MTPFFSSAKPLDMHHLARRSVQTISVNLIQKRCRDTTRVRLLKIGHGRTKVSTRVIECATCMEGIWLCGPCAAYTLMFKLNGRKTKVLQRHLLHRQRGLSALDPQIRFQSHERPRPNATRKRTQLGRQRTRELRLVPLVLVTVGCEPTNVTIYAAESRSQPRVIDRRATSCFSV